MHYQQNSESEIMESRPLLSQWCEISTLAREIPVTTKWEPGAGGTVRDNINLHATLTAEYAGAIKSVIDQIPAAHEANTVKLGLVRERFYWKGRK